MSGGHRDAAGIEAVAALDTPIHRLDPRAKIVGLIGLAIVAVSTPVGAWAAFAAYLLILVALCAAARLPPRYVLRRLSIEIPFLAAAALLPFVVADGATLALTIVSKATAGVLSMVVLSSTTPFPVLLRGFEQLKAPRLLVMIVAFMWRYLYVIGEELERMRIARQARGYQPRWFWQAGGIGQTVGALFIRSLERGERVYLAMASRGYRGGTPPALVPAQALRGADVAFVAGLVAALALTRTVIA
ncbi:MAG: cobalt ECF transporter T component CbiQ [Egibacteraceae bacterium]